MAWEMEVLVVPAGRPEREGRWVKITPEVLGANLSPYRYDDRTDAELMLQRMYPELPARQRRTVFA